MFAARNLIINRSRGQVAWRLAALAAVIALPLAYWSIIGKQEAARGQDRPECYVKKGTAKETLAASIAAIDASRPKMGPWYVVGPFDNTDNKGVETAYSPEQSIDLNAEYTGKAGVSARWQKMAGFQDGQFNDLRLFGDNDNTVAYAYREITVNSATDYPITLNGDDGINGWLNGERLIPGRTDNISGRRVTLHLKSGVNRLLIKIWQGWGGWGFSFNPPDPTKQVEEIMTAISEDFPADEFHQLSIEAANRSEYDVLVGQIANKDSINRFASTTYNASALIAEADHDPADIVLRRTQALLSDLKKSASGKNWADMQASLSELAAKSKTIEISDSSARYALYMDACRLRRKIAFANPLLDFDKILFAKHTRCGDNEGLGNHMCDQYFGWKAVPGGGIFILNNPFGAKPTLRDVLANSVVTSGRLKGQKLTQNGSYLSPSLSYDGKTIYFAYTEKGDGDLWSPGKSWHIFKAGVDGWGLAQLTDGPWNEFDPYQMQNGKLVFISERRGGFGRCHGRPVPVYTLHTMKTDGSDITCISFHESNEWNPAINNDGMIIYSRWDYVDRGFSQAHHPWITTPDGRDARAIHGNYPNNASARPWLEVHMRPIPGSQKYVAVAGPHHGQAYGSLIMIDPKVPDDDAMAPVRRITPDAAFPEGEDNRHYPNGMVYGTAWPLSEKYYIGIYDRQSAIHGVWYIDCFGNRELIYRDPKVGCLSPMPLRPRKTPPIIPDQVPTAKSTDNGTIVVMNVYDSVKPMPAGVKIKFLRIMQILPKTTPIANDPRIGYGDQKSARAVLGTVPVEEDGSAYFSAPAGKAIYFQALDENGLAVQSMRSDTYLHPGERLTCQGCHNPVRQSPSTPSRMAMALRRAPSTILPDVDGSHPFSYPRLVQGVLDKNCVSCHSKNPEAPDLSGENTTQNGGWTRSYASLRNYAFFWDNAVVDPISVTTPGQFGARASRLYEQLEKGHHGVKLSPQDMHRITLWLDSNSDFYGSYENTQRQAKGEVVWPTLD